MAKIPIRPGAFSETPEGVILLANKCQSCGQVFFPKVASCLTCFSDNLEELKLSRRGKLYSYTIGYMPSLHFPPPYAIGYVNLSERVKIFAPLIMMADKPLKVGMEMEVVLDKLWDDGENEIIGYKFKPV
jgi:uncharacterized OB-fold protein